MQNYPVRCEFVDPDCSLDDVWFDAFDRCRRPADPNNRFCDEHYIVVIESQEERNAA